MYYQSVHPAVYRVTKKYLTGVFLNSSRTTDQSIYSAWSQTDLFVPQVKHLEVSCSSMAEDICRKSAIIETYVMDSRIGDTHTHTHTR